jgi:uncharacterized protein YbaP (TraB family)
LNFYLETFHTMVKEVVIQATPQRNMRMVENIQTSLSSADKVIVIAGKSHLFGPDTFPKEKVFLSRKVFKLWRKVLSQQQTSYIILNAPLSI